MKKIIMSILKIMPVWTILGWIVDYLKENAKKTPEQWDDVAIEVLEGVVDILRENEDVIFGGVEAQKIRGSK